MEMSIYQHIHQGGSIRGYTCTQPPEYEIPYKQRNLEDVFVIDDPGDCPFCRGMRISLTELEAMLRLKSFTMFTHLVRRQKPRYGYVTVSHSGRNQVVVWVTHKEQLRTLRDVQMELGI